MNIKNEGGWIYYNSNREYSFNLYKEGKWVLFFKDMEWAINICRKAINDNAIDSCKHSSNNNGVICFYLNNDDIGGHKKLIAWFLKNNMIKKTKSGKLTNISFKLNEQTFSGKYDKNFIASIKLEDFIDLKTGIFIK